MPMAYNYVDIYVCQWYSIIKEVFMTSEQIKRLRKKLGLTQRQLAEELGVPTNTVARWEQGERTPSPPTLKALKFLEKQ